MNNSKSNIDLTTSMSNLSDEAQELVGRSPGWVLRIGPVIIFIMLLSAIIFASIVKYPDKLSGDVMLTSVNPPIELVTRVDGQIELIMVKNTQFVKSGELLACMRSGINLNDIEILKQVLSSKTNLDSVSLSALKLGSLTSLTHKFIESQRLLNFAHTHDVLGQQIVGLKSRRDLSKTMSNLQKRQHDLTIREEQLAKREYERNEALFRSSVLSPQELEINEREYLNVKKSRILAEAALNTTLIDIATIESLISDLDLKRIQQFRDLEQVIVQNRNELVDAVRIWEETYLVRSSVKGQVRFLNNWSVGQFVTKDKVLFSVDPGASEVVGIIKLPSHNSGKVKVDQDVQIRLDNYPFETYGMVLGKIKSVSPLLYEKYYRVEVAVEYPVVTSYGEEIVFHPEMPGTAYVVTNRVSLLRRLIDKARGFVLK